MATVPKQPIRNPIANAPAVRQSHGTVVPQQIKPIEITSYETFRQAIAYDRKHWPEVEAKMAEAKNK